MSSPNHSGSSAQDAKATIVLLVAVVTSFFVYLFAFVYPYNIFNLYATPKLAVYRFAQSDPMVIWRLSVAFVVLLGLYWLGWRAAQRAGGRAAWAIVLGGATALAVLLLFIYPFDAADVFDYIMHGRIVSVYGGNPFRDIANQFPDDPFYSYAGWQWSPSLYGPAWEIIDATVTRLTGDGIIANVLVFKCVMGVFLAGSTGMVALILRRAAPERALSGVVFLAWNPVVLYVTLGNGHNDVVMVFCILVAVWALLRQRYVAAILALVLGALFKFIPGLLVPAAGLVALRNLPGLRARLRFLVLTVVTSLGLVGLAYAPFWYGPEILDVSRRTRFFTASLPAFVYAWVQPVWGTEKAASIISLAALGLTALFTLWQSLRAWRSGSWLGFTHAALNILLFYLLATCAWFQQWYAVWPLGVAAVLPAGPGVYLAMVLGGYAVLSKQIIFGPLIWRIHPFPRGTKEIWFGPTVLGVPWLYAFFSLLDQFVGWFARERPDG